MANRKISDLTALTAPASGDYLPIVDISEAAAADKNKRITVEELLRGAPNGTAGAPGIAFESDPNTGIYSPGADQLAISTNGTGRLLILSDGKVGLGTVTPRFIQDIVGTANGPAQIVAGFGSTSATIGDGTAIGFSTEATQGVTGRHKVGIGSIRTGSFDRGALCFYLNDTASAGNFTSSDERLRITSDGKVGLGTSAFSSGAKAEIATASGQERIYIQGNNNSSNSYLYIEAPADRRKAIVFRSGGSDRACIGVGDSDELAVDKLFLSANVNSGGTSPHMVIDSSGRVGVGTNTASALLHLKGSPSAIIHLQPANDTVSNYITFRNAADATRGYLQYDYASDYLALGTANSERARIDSSGRLGIGTTSPNGRLEVNEASNAAETFPLYVANTGVGVNTRASIRFNVANSYYGSIGGGAEADGSSSVIVDASSSTGIIKFTRNNKAAETARFDGSGRLLVGTSSSSSTGSALQVNGRVEQVDGVFTKRAISTYTSGQTISVTVANAPAGIGNSESSIYRVFATRGVNSGSVTFEMGYVYYTSNGTGTYATVVNDANITVSVSGTTISAENTGGSATLRLIVTCETTAFNTGS